jgi:hypothetical protein
VSVSGAASGGVRGRSALGVVARLATTLVALAVAMPVAMVLALLVIGFSDADGQVTLPLPFFLLQFVLALVAPLCTAAAVGWWGLWAVRLGGRVPVWVVVGAVWLSYAGLLVLDCNWDRVGFAPPGHLWLRNTTGARVAYSTSPRTDDIAASYGTPEMSPGERRVLTGLPTDAPLRVRATDATGRTVYCREFTPDDVRRVWGRVDVTMGVNSCP